MDDEAEERPRDAPSPGLDEVDEHLRIVSGPALCWHEAGHVAAIWAVGAAATGADVLPDGRFGGRALFSFEGCYGVTVARLVITAAGPAAARRWDREKPDGGEQDRDDIERGLRALCRSTEAADIVRRHVLAEAARVVAANWDAVEAVAEALLSRGVLTGDDLAEILDGVEHARKLRSWRELLARTAAASSSDPRSS